MSVFMHGIAFVAMKGFPTQSNKKETPVGVSFLLWGVEGAAPYRCGFSPQPLNVKAPGVLR